MKTRLLPLLLLAALSTAFCFADEVLMKNGEKVIGSIIKKDAANLTIKSPSFGVVTLPWAQIAEVKAEQPINVVLGSGKTVEATVATVGDKLEISSGGAKETVAPADVVALRDAAEEKAFQRMLKPRLRDLWVLTGSIGLSGTAGNAKTSTFTTPVQANRVTRNDKTTVYFNYIRATATVNNVSSTTAKAVRGGWSHNRNLKPRLFWNVFNDYEFDRFQNLDLRVVIGSGLGYQAWKGERGGLSLVAGGAWNREAFDPVTPPQAPVRNSSEAYWGDDFTYKLNSRASLVQTYRMFNNLTNTGTYRQNFDLGISTRLTKWLTANASASDRFLSNPVSGRKRNDFLYTFGLGFTVAR